VRASRISEIRLIQRGIPTWEPRDRRIHESPLVFAERVIAIRDPSYALPSSLSLFDRRASRETEERSEDVPVRVE